MKIAYFWLTLQGKELAERLQSVFGGVVEPKANFSQTVAQDFSTCDALVFVMATGIVVRTLAPFLQSKATDPAVVVLDQKGSFVISLLSGHLGGANQLTREIASAIGAVPVITTATDVQGVIAWDEFAKRNGLKIENLEVLKRISGALLEGETVAFCSDVPLAPDFAIPQVAVTKHPGSPYQVFVTDRMPQRQSEGCRLLLRPQSLVIGVGCKRNISPEHLEQCLQTFLQTYGLSPLSVVTIATIGLKQQEPAILQLCQKYGYTLEIVPEEAIRDCSYPFEASAFVQEITGLPSVAQACSYLASGCGEMLTGKVKYAGVTLSACRKKVAPLVW